MTYTPQVGDRVTQSVGDIPSDRWVDVIWSDDDVFVARNPEGVKVLLHHGDTWQEVEPRPKVREHVGYVWSEGLFTHNTNAADPEWQAKHPNLPPARIVAKTFYIDRHIDGDETITVAVVCGLDGEPLEVEQ